MTIEQRRLPRVVIAGRPNVGKSTLFNRLYGRRRAITDPTPGVTRDIIEEQCTLSGYPVVLVDTGGVKADYEDVFDDLVSNRSLSTLRSADVILLLLEIGGLTPEDELLIDRLRPFADRLVVTVNKADIPEKDYQAAEYFALGLGDPVPVSSAHGRNIDELIRRIGERLDAYFSRSGGGRTGEGGDEPAADRPLTIAIVGRPNAGKSTLANRITGSDHSLVSDIPGTTRDTISAGGVHRGRPLLIVDTAGMRRKSRVSQNIEYYSVNRAIRAMFEADVTILLVDSGEGLSDQDKKITAQAVKKGRTVVMVLSKWDEAVPDRSRLKKAVDRIRFQFPVLDWAPITPVSALHGYGITGLLDLVVRADDQQNTRIETGELNRALAEWVELTPPPTRKGRTFRIRYITQVATRPARFVAFVNRAAGFPDSYRRFVINQIRKEFGFDLVPVELDIRESAKVDRVGRSMK